MNLDRDGICSPVSILDTDIGRSSYTVSIAIIVIVELDVIRQSPSRFVATAATQCLTSVRSP
ncbi:hypothetical protein [Nostoc sp. NMS4]|uniref:hypothetical protein n=1 Tax=Nostoc sp. NMS4 TaxID=2815390 RepID=UPI0025FC3184|nr:hypothetical protein [Nostoc sp. NMS4]MBN3926953.1 hypothetical protein [Nostoc sp. NMS4]